MRRLCMSMLIIAVLNLCSLTAHAAIINGDFASEGTAPDPFAAWETFSPLGDPPEDGGGFARFTARDFLEDQQLEQWFTLPTLADTLSFEYRIAASLGGTSTNGAPPDSFQATLYDSGFSPLFPSDAFLVSFFSVDVGGTPFFDPAFVSLEEIGSGWNRVSLDVSTLASQNLLIEFLALGSNDGLLTSIDLDNVMVTAVPEPASITILSMLAAACVSRLAVGSWLGRIGLVNAAPRALAAEPVTRS
jgi:hypothetical protein